MGLRVVYPPGLAGTAVPLSGELFLGRLPDERQPSLVALGDSTISRCHAKIRRAETGFLLEDLGSRNGTYLNGTELTEPSLLLPQMVCRLGDVMLVVDELTDAVFDASSAVPGVSPSIVELRKRLPLAAKDHGTVLIAGETGTGKERLAAEVHRVSERRGAFIAVNCAELSEHLIESQLFGHERGAFTGATQSRSGLFVAAHEGTLFLDEIGELPLELQSKLLRVLEDQELRPVGSVHTRKVDVRVVAATNRDLRKQVEQGRFRRDLHARLASWELTLPPLRARRQDLLRWIDTFAELENRDAHRRLHLSANAAERILCHPWLDNLRGVHRLVRRLTTMGETVCGLRVLSEVMPELASELSTEQETTGGRPWLNDSGERRAVQPSPGTTAETPRVALKPPPAPTREEFLQVYEANHRNVRATARHFQRDRRQIYRWLERYGFQREEGEE